MAKIFISYRRDDSAGYVGRLVRDLNEIFGPEQIFQDIQAIEAGEDFVEAIDRAVGACVVLLVLIGSRWLSATDGTETRRLDDPHDFVRLEISSALRRSIRVIPVLVQGATMPTTQDLPEELRSLVRRQAHEISDKRWDYDVGKLIESLEKMPELERRRVSAKTEIGSPTSDARAKSGLSVAKMIVGGAGVAVIALAVFFLYPFEEQPEEEDLAVFESAQYDRYASPEEYLGVEGEWVLTDTDPGSEEIWQISRVGNGLHLEIRERQSGLVVASGTGSQSGDTMKFHNLRIDETRAGAELALTAGGKTLVGELVFEDDQDAPEPITLIR